MKVLFVVTQEDATGYLISLADACHRATLSYSVFFTGAGVKTLSDSTMVDVISQADEAVACEFSWDQLMASTPCPVEMGSQTDHSRMIKFADRAVPL